MKRSTAQNNLYYQRLLKVFGNAAAFMPLVMVPFGLLARSSLVDNRFYNSDLVFILIVFAYSLTSIIYFYVVRLTPTPKTYASFLFIFHALTLLFVLFVSGFLSAYLSVWIVLMISAEMYFGSRGFLLSFMSLCLAGLLSVIIHPEMPTGEQFETIQGAIVVGAIGYVISRIRNVTDHERVALAKTREQESFERERLLALVNSMGDAVVTTNEQGAIKVYNAATLGLLDTNEGLTGKSLDDLLKLRDKTGKQVSLLDQAREKHIVFSRTDLAHAFSDGEIMKLYINVAPIKPGYQARGEHGFIIVMRDITKEKSLEEERDEFISVVSHELRTPVAIAEGNLSNLRLLQEHHAKKEVFVKAIDDAHDQVMYLAKMINDLSTLSRAERGIADAPEEIDVADMVQTLYKEYHPQAEAKGLQFNLDLAPRLPKLLASRLYLEEIMQNLVTNAIKYTKEGSVTVRAHGAQKGIRLEVKDTGIGISKSDQKHMFEKFFRSEDYRTRETSGTGLGLYVVHKLAEKLKVQVTFVSRLNHGSTFSFVIKNQEPPK